jgi:PiT family inorganic phosphate transporter
LVGEFSLGLIIVLLMVLVAEFVNGATDAPNSIATVVSTRVLSPRKAVVMATVLNAVGVMSGMEVAITISKGFVQHDAINLLALGSAMLAIVVWSSLAWKFGLPTSESHALVASLTGAAFAAGGFEALLWVGWKKVFIGLLFSTFLGFGGGYLVNRAISWGFRRADRHYAGNIFGRLQVVSAAFMAFSHGSNDGQKFMGIFVLALVVGGVLPPSDKFLMPWWVIGLCAAMMAIGTSVGGWRIIKTMGMKMVKLEPYQGFAAETGAATAIQIASSMGIPVSTTHTISTSIMGVGAARRFSAVRWGVVGDVVATWVLTFPACAFIGWAITFLIKRYF